MKSIKDYVNLEAQYYQTVLDNYQQLFFEKFTIAEVKNIDNIVIYATGSSSNAAYGALPFMSELLGIPIRIEEPSISGNYLLNIGKNTLCLAISQGGHSYSVIKLVKKLQRKHSVYALTSDLASPLAKESNNILAMGIPVEEMPYVSAGYSIEILDLILVALTIAIRKKLINQVEFQEYVAEIKLIISQIPKVIKISSQWVDDNLASFNQAKRITFIGYGAAYGVSREGETKITEAVRISAWGKELEEYMHGPYLGIKKDDSVICLEPNGRLKEREVLLKQFLQKHVDNVYTICASTANGKDLGLEVRTDELLTALFMTIPIHLLAYRLSQQKGNDLVHSAYPDFDKITASKI